jgi:hypothetical protein
VYDFVYSVRMLSKDLRFVVLAVATLGLGFGAATAVFAVFDTALIRALPVRRHPRPAFDAQRRSHPRRPSSRRHLLRLLAARVRRRRDRVGLDAPRQWLSIHNRWHFRPGVSRLHRRLARRGAGPDDDARPGVAGLASARASLYELAQDLREIEARRVARAGARGDARGVSAGDAGAAGRTGRAAARRQGGDSRGTVEYRAGRARFLGRAETVRAAAADSVRSWRCSC